MSGPWAASNWANSSMVMAHPSFQKAPCRPWSAPVPARPGHGTAATSKRAGSSPARPTPGAPAFPGNRTAPGPRAAFPAGWPGHRARAVVPIGVP
ncbi:hypothetical protein AZA_12220 [Nitrospirillum viridazoti Y2]|nr:hypothetical protein AZA_12220 [Nitrospirillum amazonense Y2]